MDSDDSDYGPATAFPINLINEKEIDLNLPPSNGMEYLHRVMLEAKRCDQVVTAQPPPSRNFEHFMDVVTIDLIFY